MLSRTSWFHELHAPCLAFGMNKVWRGVDAISATVKLDRNRGSGGWNEFKRFLEWTKSNWVLVGVHVVFHVYPWWTNFDFSSLSFQLKKCFVEKGVVNAIYFALGFLRIYCTYRTSNSQLDSLRKYQIVSLWSNWELEILYLYVRRTLFIFYYASLAMAMSSKSMSFNN